VPGWKTPTRIPVEIVRFVYSFLRGFPVVPDTNASFAPRGKRTEYEGASREPISQEMPAHSSSGDKFQKRNFAIEMLPSRNHCGSIASPTK